MAPWRSGGRPPGPPVALAARMNLARSRDPDDLELLRELFELPTAQDPRRHRDQEDLLPRGDLLDDSSEELQDGREIVALDQVLQAIRSEEHTSELQSRPHLVCRLL